MVYMPSDGHTYMGPVEHKERVKFLRRRRWANRNTKVQDASVLKGISRRVVLLRTYEKDMEMRRIPSAETGVLLLDPLAAASFNGDATLQWAQRVNMLAHVPELSLVVAASQVGRVALLTLTKLRPSGAGDAMRQNMNLGVQRGFRTDWILPTREDEQAGRRPPEALYGMAIGPVQEVMHKKLYLRRARNIERLEGPVKRFRLLLHYRDHTILAYEITRHGPEGEIFVD